MFEHKTIFDKRGVNIDQLQFNYMKTTFYSAVNILTLKAY